MCCPLLWDRHRRPARGASPRGLEVLCRRVAVLPDVLATLHGSDDAFGTNGSDHRTDPALVAGQDGKHGACGAVDCQPRVSRSREVTVISELPP